MDQQEPKLKQEQPQETKQQEQKQEAQQSEQKHEETEAKQDTENKDGKKDPETLSEGERMGLSKQQLRKLEKRLAAEAKKKKQLEVAAEKEAQKAQNKQDKKQKGKKPQKEIQATPEQIKELNHQKIPTHPNKKIPSADKKNILITSALPYVNNVPHLGNIIGCVLSADVYARFKRLQGDNVLYVCGTDQYGTATEVKALQENKTPKQVCDYYHAIHKNVYEWFDIGFDYFGRTSTEWHAKICQEIFLNLHKNQRIIKQSMTQCFCQNCDMFLADRFVGGTCPFCEFPDARGDQCDKCQKLFNSPLEMKNPFCTICKKPPVERETQHFFIDLPKIQGELEKWIQHSSVNGKWSQNSTAVTKGWINLGLKPKCITRDLKWGVPVPLQQYSKKVFYVWYDAPIGYISITANLLGQDYSKWWRNPEQVQLYQFMGKDNVPFHTVMFPSSLIAANKDWTLLHHISTTQYLNYQSGKFSKRNGTGVFGDSAAQTGIPSEVWRYYLLVNRPEKSDSQFSWADFVQKNNSELLANLGNLVQRVLKFCYIQYEKTIPKFTFDQLDQLDVEFLKNTEQKYKKYVQLLNNVEIKQGLKAAMELSSLGNKYLQDTKFWQKQNKLSGRTKIVIAISLNFIRLLSLVFQPYMPSTSAKINYLLGIERTERDEIFGQILNEAGLFNIFNTLTEESKGLRTPIVLFRNYTAEETQIWRAKFGGKAA